MATVVLPRDCTLDRLMIQLDAADAFSPDWESLVIHLPDGCFLHCAAIGFLAAWGLERIRAGQRLLLRGDKDSESYLARLDLHRHWGLDFDPGKRQAETGRFLPLRLVASESDCLPVVDAICGLVVHQFDNAAAFVPALEWAAYEIVDNILLHAQIRSPGAVCAQYFPEGHRLDVAICDLGRGLKASLEESHRLWGHGDAIRTALQRGVTRNPEEGQGNGMAGAQQIVLSNAGGLCVWSGDTIYTIEHGQEEGFTDCPSVLGTGVFFSLDTRRPVDLRQTWIAGGEWTYLDRAAEGVVESGGIDVAAECINTGTRLPARRLRRRIQALLAAEAQPTVVLDFGNVRSASSSFLDELLGRLAANLGEPAFHSKLRIVGISDLAQDLANSVIRQRLT